MVQAVVLQVQEEVLVELQLNQLNQEIQETMDLVIPVAQAQLVAAVVPAAVAQVLKVVLQVQVLVAAV